MEKVTFKTRVAKDKDAVTTNAQVDFTGVSDEQLKELAMRSVIIAVQSNYRAAENVPAEDTILVADMFKPRTGGGAKPTVENVAKRAGALSSEDKAALVKQLQAELKAHK